MSANPQYPRTRYGPPDWIDLSSRGQREKLSAGAIKGFLNIVERWRVRDEDARALLGGLSNGAYYQYKREPNRVLDEDRLRRIGYLVGIFKALNILYSEALADQWMQLPNKNRLFAGSTPLDYLVRGGLPAFINLRRLLDARRGG